MLLTQNKLLPFTVKALHYTLGLEAVLFSDAEKHLS